MQRPVHTEDLGEAVHLHFYFPERFANDLTDSDSTFTSNDTSETDETDSETYDNTDETDDEIKNLLGLSLDDTDNEDADPTFDIDKYTTERLPQVPRNRRKM